MSDEEPGVTTRPRLRLDTTSADESQDSGASPADDTSDPLGYRPVLITDHQLDGAVAAAHHLLDLGYPPIFPLAVVRAIWKRDRKLSMTLARIRGVL